MELSSILLLIAVATQTAFSWDLRWGPLKSDRTPTYRASHWWNVEKCQDFRNTIFLSTTPKKAKDPAPNLIWWQPATNDNNGCCLTLYGSSTGAGFANHNCRKLEGGYRYSTCGKAPVKIPAAQGIGSFRIMGCKGRNGKPAPTYR